MYGCTNEKTLCLRFLGCEKPIACVSYSLVGNSVQIRYLFVRKRYRNFGIEQYMLKKVNNYAKKKNAKEIIVYLGVEPFCEDGQMPLEIEKSFYEKNGFKLSHLVQKVVPCMKKNMKEQKL